MIDFWVHPTVIFLLGALLLPIFRGPLRKPFMVLVPILAFWSVLSMEHGVFGVFHFMRWEVTFGRVDALSQVFGHIMTLMAIIGTIYGLHEKENAQLQSAWVYASGSLGVIFAGDYLVVILFWELMAVSSTLLVWFRRQPDSPARGMRYLLVHTFGGALLLAGIILRYKAVGDFAFVHENVDAPSLYTYMIMLGFILNAAVPPLHAWLPDAYSGATVPGAVFMSCYTTKTAVYALCRGLAGLDILVILGTIMALYGVIYAILQNDARKLFAYHIVSQVGYMVTGVGIGTEFAINGAVAHAFAHIIYKGLLFMGSGSVLHMTGTSKATELGGLWEKMPMTFLYTLIGGLSISAFPLFSGFISKSMIVSASYEEHLLLVGFLLTLAASGTFLSTTLKVPYFIWFGKNKCSQEVWDKAKDPPWNMQLAMFIASFLCIFIGCYTPYLYDMLPYPVDYHPYTAYHITESYQILFFTMLAYFMMLKKAGPEPVLTLDLDWFYRFPKPFFQVVFVNWVDDFFKASLKKGFEFAGYLQTLSRNPMDIIREAKKPARDYDPDADRPPLGIPIMLSLATAVVAVLWTFWLYAGAGGAPHH